jgi:DNA polymerase-4
MDAFFASVEQVKNPSLKDKPFIVCWIGKHSIVSSPNYVARTYGIKAAMPIHTAQNLCKNLILVPIDFKAYQQFHDRFVDIIKSNYSKIIEVSSIDECYIDITHLVKNKIEAIALAKTIQDKIYDELKITCSIGVSNNKFLAKMGSDLRKPFGISPIYKTNIKDKL